MKHLPFRRVWAPLLAALLLAALHTPALAEAADESAAAYTRALVAASWDAALQGIGAESVPFADALGQWFADNAHTRKQDGGYITELIMPNLKNLNTQRLPLYAGDDPFAYMQKLATEIRDGLPRLLKQGLWVGPVRHDPRDDGAPPADPDFVLAMQDTARAFSTTWLHKALTATRAHSALSRIVLDDRRSPDFWKSLPFTPATQTPAYMGGYAVIRLGSTGDPARAAQAALIAQGYLTGKVSNKFGRQAVAATLAYEQAKGLTPDGELSPDEQAVLFGTANLPYLPILYLDAEEQAVRRWWPLYLRSLQQITWHATTLTITVTQPEIAGLADAWFADWLAAFNRAEATADNIPAALDAALIARLAKDADPGDAETFTLTIPLQAFLNPDLQPADILSPGAAQPLRQGFTALAETGDAVTARAQAHAAARPAPQPFPGKAVLYKRANGTAQLILQNSKDVPMLLDLYAAQDAADFTATPDNLACTVFLAPGDRVKVSVRPGYYHVRLAAGSAWYGEDVRFGPEGVYLNATENYELRHRYASTLAFGVTPQARDKAVGFAVDGQ
ncbi:MAG: peptidoglycan-binding protein [Oscillospiraceae bacterium]|jgi:hypothetical protein|nr:peptidoglycan-binding protein [Oscillospiraceae bacterium]